MTPTPRQGQGVDLGDYVEVAERIAEFREKYPTGCLRPANLDRPYDIVTIGDQTYVVVVTAAYRAPDDPMPGVDMAWEPVPGRTPYTRNSELMNASTSAAGRAIVATLAADAKRGIASATEIRNRRAEDPDPRPRPSVPRQRTTPPDPEEHQRARSATRRLQKEPPVLPPDPTKAATAGEYARAATTLEHLPDLTKLWTKIQSEGLQDQPVDQHIPPDLLRVAYPDGTDLPLTLGRWIYTIRGHLTHTHTAVAAWTPPTDGPAA